MATADESPKRASEPPGQDEESSPALDDPRKESVAQRADRNLTELIQELRVAGLGVQVLFGFLLSIPFTVKFDRLDGAQLDMYLSSVVLCAVATTLLIGPVAYHRIVFRRSLKDHLVRFANVMAILGLGAVGGAVLDTVLLVTDFVAGTLPAVLITSMVGLMIVALWFAVPLRAALKAPRRQ